MGRKRKSDIWEEKNARRERWTDFNLAGEVKRSVAAVFLFALALVVVLGFWDKAGVVGKDFNKVISILVGWAKWVFPVFLLAAGVILLIKEKSSFYISKLLGLLIALAGVAGFLHWFFDAERMLAAAKSGSGGGYLGYITTFLATKYLGRAGGLVTIIALFLCGTVVAFNVSITEFIEGMKKRREEKLALKAEAEKNAAEEAEASEPTVAETMVNEGKEMEKVEVPADAKAMAGEADEDGIPSHENIGKIEFVEGRDQYVDEKLLNGAAGFNRKNFSVKKKVFDNVNKNKASEDNWLLPGSDLLESNSGVAKSGDMEKNAEIIESTLRNFGIEVKRGEFKVGPSVTQYSFSPAVGVKISKIVSLQNDISLALALHPIRIEAPIPGKSLIGIEVPNKVPAIVRMRNVVELPEFEKRENNLMLALGKDVGGEYLFASLSKMPHLLIAGSTGTGKSVCINSIITTLLYQNSPEDLKLILVDPKRVELSLYAGIPHLLSNVIVENGKVINALKAMVGEMEKRYKMLQDFASKDIASYNEKVEKGATEKYVDPETGEVKEGEAKKLPYIVIVIDELADLMGTHGKEVEGAIVRLAQMARAVGIHLIVSTQRPSVEVITGLIKANITTRIAFQVPTQIDSRTIIDMAGAEKLLGNGDMLYLSASSPKPRRIQGIFVSESEVKRVVKFLRDQKEKNDKKKRAEGREELEEESIISEEKTSIADGVPVIFSGSSQNSDGLMEFSATTQADSVEDDLYESAKQEVIRAKKASASLLQRRLRVGYARAARLLDVLEERGVVGPADGAKPRDVFVAEETGEIKYENQEAEQETRDKWDM